MNRQPLLRSQVIDDYFMEHRARLIDIAAFLDRLDRVPSEDLPEDFRVKALCEALAILTDGKGQRVRRVLESLSDPTREPILEAGTKGASGAYAGQLSPSSEAQ